MTKRKIMFSDKYGLTQAILEGRKTQTRRIITYPKTFKGKDVCGLYVYRWKADGVIAEICMYDRDEISIDEDISCDEVNGIVDIRAKQNKENMEEKKLNLKPFDLEAAKAGKPVCTRDGRKVRIISFDRHGEDCPIIALVVDSKNAECEEVIDYTLDGICNENIINHNKYDLMMFTRKKEGWVNVYKSDNNKYSALLGSAYVYKTKGEAELNFDEDNGLATVKIEWEE